MNWGDSYFFHPDENNMVTAILQMDKDNLNPNFFAYGQFPLYLTYFTTPQHTFPSITLTLRFWSALFSSFSVLFFYLILSHFFKNKKILFLTTLLFIFLPGLIQSAHFGTTESLLSLLFLINIYLSLKLLDKYKVKYLFFLSLSSGLALATKISSFLFLTPVYLSLIFLFSKKKNIKNLIKRLSIFTFLSLLIFLLFSPYNFLDFASFWKSISYELKVATGQLKVFYTRQFLNTSPYLFQFKNIFPYAISIPILILSLFGIINLPKKKSKKILLVLTPVIIFFLYQGQLFVKWTRFMTPIFFIFPFLAAFFLNKIKNNFLLFPIIFISILPGLFFLNIYFQPDIRLQASQWLKSNLKNNAQVISESNNVLNLPLGQHNFQVFNFDFYNLENNPQLKQEFQKYLSTADYIIIPSRRVFKNHHSPNYPYVEKYYQDLFSQQLPFKKIKEFKVKNTFLLNSENAEETYSVFDHPTIRIYQRLGDYEQ